MWYSLPYFNKQRTYGPGYVDKSTVLSTDNGFEKLENTRNLTLFQQSVQDLYFDKGSVAGVQTQAGIIFQSEIVVLTVGTFLNGLIHIGSSSFTAGRAGEPASLKLSENMVQLEIELGRLKTGTPPRLSKSSINFDLIEEQKETPQDLYFPFSIIQSMSLHKFLVT